MCWLFFFSLFSTVLLCILCVLLHFGRPWRLVLCVLLQLLYTSCGFISVCFASTRCFLKSHIGKDDKTESSTVISSTHPSLILVSEALKVGVANVDGFAISQLAPCRHVRRHLFLAVVKAIHPLAPVALGHLLPQDFHLLIGRGNLREGKGARINLAE